MAPASHRGHRAELPCGPESPGGCGAPASAFGKLREKARVSRTGRRTRRVPRPHPHILSYRKKTILSSSGSIASSLVLFLDVPITSLSCLFVKSKRDEALGRNG